MILEPSGSYGTKYRGSSHERWIMSSVGEGVVTVVHPRRVRWVRRHNTAS
jgi:hypothetical protein